MSLTGALLSANYGLRKSQNQIAVASANVANADREGYTRKSYQETAYLSVNGTSVAYRDDIVRETNIFLSETVIQEKSTEGFFTVADTFMKSYDQSMGTTGGQSSLTASLDSLVVSVETLVQTPENGSASVNVSQAADDLAFQLNRQSDEIQALRERADQEIGKTVREINDLLEEIDSLNEEILNAEGRQIESADLEDERMIALEELAGLMDIQYHTTSQDRIQIYSYTGELLLGSKPKTLEFTSSSFITGDESYPGALSGISVEGEDITRGIRNGELGALLDLRDTEFVQEQEKLNEFATELMTALNTAHNSGASVTAPPSLSGTQGFTGASSLAGSTGTFRVAATDTSGDVVEFVDIDMTTINTVTDLVTAINGMANISAAIDGNGALTMQATAGNGIALRDVGAVDTAGSGQGVSDYFGLNNLFDPRSTNAENIRVRDDLLDTPQYMTTGRLNDDAALAVGDKGVKAGDSSGSLAMLQAFEAQQTFDAAGELSAQTDTFQGYISTVIASGAEKVEDAANDAQNAVLEYETAKEALLNFTGINVDEELTRITVIQDAYAASATVISVIQEMFDRLLNAVN